MHTMKILRNEVEGIKIFEDEKFEINYTSMNNVYEKDKIFLHEVGESNIFSHLLFL